MIDLNKYSSISSFLSAIASFVATFTALWIVCSEQKRIEKYRKKKIEKADVDLILIPTKEWDSGAKYQELNNELTGLNGIIQQANEVKRNSSLADFYVPNQRQEEIQRQIEYIKKNNIAKKLFKDNMHILSLSEFYWIQCERIYGVNIKEDISVVEAKQRLIVTQYFKEVLITEKGRKHDISLSKCNSGHKMKEKRGKVQEQDSSKQKEALRSKYKAI